jgi:hypothetical protein
LIAVGCGAWIAVICSPTGKLSATIGQSAQTVDLVMKKDKAVKYPLWNAQLSRKN